ncbi:MAG: hypothetical protein M3119_05830 [Verrucomicrobiota bacterium]|nr:hypothetical protein [Verrucomicrobiota bacterium]MDQ6939661.1 hypothetical protein [Verrucomicrobiota bacterium]
MSKLERLLRAAVAAPNSESFRERSDSLPDEMPFGFDTRVLANWRASRSSNGNGALEFARYFKRIAMAAVVVATCASAGAFWQLRQNNDLDEATGGAYAMADSAIEANTLQ